MLRVDNIGNRWNFNEKSIALKLMCLWMQFNRNWDCAKCGTVCETSYSKWISRLITAKWMWITVTSRTSEYDVCACFFFLFFGWSLCEYKNNKMWARRDKLCVLFNICTMYVAQAFAVNRSTLVEMF